MRSTSNNIEIGLLWSHWWIGEFLVFYSLVCGVSWCDHSGNLRSICRKLQKKSTFVPSAAMRKLDQLRLETIEWVCVCVVCMWAVCCWSHDLNRLVDDISHHKCIVSGFLSKKFTTNNKSLWISITHFKKFHSVNIGFIGEKGKY